MGENNIYLDGYYFHFLIYLFIYEIKIEREGKFIKKNIHHTVRECNIIIVSRKKKCSEVEVFLISVNK